MNLNLAEGIQVAKPLLIYLAGIVIYSIFIFSFYKFLAKKDLFKIDLSKYNTAHHRPLKKTIRLIFYLCEHILVYPVFVFIWFVVLALLISFLSKSQGAEIIMLVTAALIGSVRATAYISEDLSNDLSKMMPFSLLGVFILDISYASPSHTKDVALGMIPLWNIVLYYVLILICLELALRLAYEIYRHVFASKTKSDVDSHGQY